jgi:hypothetical protein
MKREFMSDEMWWILMGRFLAMYIGLLCMNLVGVKDARK